MTDELIKEDPTAGQVSAPLTQPLNGYCLKCKTTRPMVEGRAVFMANGRPAAEGKCAECGARLFKIGATPEHAGLSQPAAAPQAKARAALELIAQGYLLGQDLPEILRQAGRHWDSLWPKAN